jgi:quinol monooxygenase YgiN
VHARSTMIRGRPESVDDGIAFCRDEVLPMCRELPGCVGLSVIVDRGSGRCIATTSWDSIESMRATTTQMQPIRQRAAEIIEGTPEVRSGRSPSSPRPPVGGRRLRTSHLASG